MSGKFKPAESEVEEEVLDISNIGEGLKETKAEKVELDHSFAEHILSLNEFSGDRHLSSIHVGRLVEHMKRGTFHPEWVNIITCRCAEKCRNQKGEEVAGGATWRMNGQHTAHARLQMPASYRCPVMLRRYTAKSEYDMRLLYTSIDRGRPRGRHGQSKALLSGIKELDHLKPAYLRYIDPAFGMWKWESREERAKHDANEVAYLIMTEDLAPVVNVMTFINDIQYWNNRWLMRAPVVGAMFATFAVKPRLAKDFWEPVITGVGYDEAGDPRNRLRARLMTTNLAQRTAGSTSTVVDSETMYRWCLQAWNLWRSGQTVAMVRAAARGRPQIK